MPDCLCGAAFVDHFQWNLDLYGSDPANPDQQDCTVVCPGTWFSVMSLTGPATLSSPTTYVPVSPIPPGTVPT